MNKSGSRLVVPMCSCKVCVCVKWDQCHYSLPVFFKALSQYIFSDIIDSYYQLWKTVENSKMALNILYFSMVSQKYTIASLEIA